MDAFLNGFVIGGIFIKPAQILFALLVFALILLLGRKLREFLLRRALPRTHLDINMQYLAATVVHYALIALAVVVGLKTAGVDLGGLAIITGALSVGLGFGLQNIVNNFVSGMIVLFERPIKVNDWIAIDGKEGFVRRIALRSTHIEMADRSILIVPNGDLISKQVINWTYADKLFRIKVAVRVTFGTDTEIVKNLLLDVAKQNPKVADHPAAAVSFDNFGDNGINLSLIAYTADAAARGAVQNEMHHAVEKAFRDNKIDMPFAPRAA